MRRKITQTDLAKKFQANALRSKLNSDITEMWRSSQLETNKKLYLDLFVEYKLQYTHFLILQLMDDPSFPNELIEPYQNLKPISIIGDKNEYRTKFTIEKIDLIVKSCVGQECKSGILSILSFSVIPSTFEFFITKCMIDKFCAVVVKHEKESNYNHVYVYLRAVFAHPLFRQIIHEEFSMYLSEFSVLAKEIIIKQSNLPIINELQSKIKAHIYLMYFLGQHSGIQKINIRNKGPQITPPGVSRMSFTPYYGTYDIKMVKKFIFKNLKNFMENKNCDSKYDGDAIEGECKIFSSLDALVLNERIIISSEFKSVFEVYYRQITPQYTIIADNFYMKKLFESTEILEMNFSMKKSEMKELIKESIVNRGSLSSRFRRAAAYEHAKDSEIEQDCVPDGKYSFPSDDIKLYQTGLSLKSFIDDIQKVKPYDREMFTYSVSKKLYFDYLKDNTFKQRYDEIKKLTGFGGIGLFRVLGGNSISYESYMKDETSNEKKAKDEITRKNFQVYFSDFIYSERKSHVNSHLATEIHNHTKQLEQSQVFLAKAFRVSDPINQVRQMWKAYEYALRVFEENKIQFKNDENLGILIGLIANHKNEDLTINLNSRLKFALLPVKSLLENGVQEDLSMFEWYEKFYKYFEKVFNENSSF